MAMISPACLDFIIYCDTKYISQYVGPQSGPEPEIPRGIIVFVPHSSETQQEPATSQQQQLGVSLLDGIFDGT
jgi:hypothetical protein